jgi:hypothetical protein
MSTNTYVKKVIPRMMYITFCFYLSHSQILFEYKFIKCGLYSFYWVSSGWNCSCECPGYIAAIVTLYIPAVYFYYYCFSIQKNTLSRPRFQIRGQDEEQDRKKFWRSSETISSLKHVI